MSRPLSETLPLLLQEEMKKLAPSLPVTVAIFLPSITKSLPRLTEQQANNVAEQILDFAGKVWKLQQDAKIVDLVVVKTEAIEETEIRALPAARN